MRIIFLLCIAFLLSDLQAQEVKKLTWTDLVVTVEFEDPFLELDSEQLYNLSLVARFREKEADQAREITASESAQKDSLEQLLASESVDVDYLLSMRYQIKELREQRAGAVDTSLNNTKIKIPGYLLPLNYDNEKTTEFLLVPWVGACIHPPPPPRNQIIYIKTKEGIPPMSQFEAVTIEGVITTVATTSTLYLVDGSDKISSGYSILDAKISRYGH